MAPFAKHENKKSIRKKYKKKQKVRKFINHLSIQNTQVHHI
jgi:hypothetical protein